MPAQQGAGGVRMLESLQDAGYCVAVSRIGGRRRVAARRYDTHNLPLFRPNRPSHVDQHLDGRCAEGVFIACTIDALSVSIGRQRASATEIVRPTRSPRASMQTS